MVECGVDLGNRALHVLDLGNRAVLMQAIAAIDCALSEARMQAAITQLLKLLKKFNSYPKSTIGIFRCFRQCCLTISVLSAKVPRFLSY